MTARWPLGCRSVLSHHDANSRLLRAPLLARARLYASQQSKQKKIDSSPRPPSSTTAVYDVKAALKSVERGHDNDPINPARSTLPPPLDLPTRGSESTFVHWFRIGRAFGTFYKDGIKSVWYNFRAALKVARRIREDNGAKDITDAVERKLITRADFQLWVRSRHDVNKLPLFSVLVLILGEWLVFIVPYMPRVVPRTCRIPKQVKGMREKAERRRSISFRQGVTEPTKEQFFSNDMQIAESERGYLITRSPVAFNEQWKGGKLRADQLHHLSSSLGLHSSIWDRLHLSPPAFLMRRAVSRHLAYLTLDDILLLNAGNNRRFNTEELFTACEERGLDVTGKSQSDLHHTLDRWLERRDEGGWRNRALFTMLFKRPNSW